MPTLAGLWPSPSQVHSLLAGSVVNGRWRLIRPNERPTSASGGNFSITYEVTEVTSEKPAFIKFVDVWGAFTVYGQSMSVAEVLAKIANEHLFEVKLGEICRSNGMSRVVQVLDSGDYQMSIPHTMPLALPYIVFEHAAEGDAHCLRAKNATLGAAWWLRTMHHVSVGLQQLHLKLIAHQDIKASNVVFFGPDEPKIADLGRAVHRGVLSSNDSKNGDPIHSPPELFYGYHPQDWSERFLSVDLYMLGNLAFQHFAGYPLTSALFHYLDPNFNPMIPSFKGTFQDALPALEYSYARVLEKFKQGVPEAIANDLTLVICQLCQPNPYRRGHPKNFLPFKGQRYSVERYINIFLRMAKTLEISPQI